jgi:EAL domain-containing protein (putative c-di-GMP-specific phosphodiesterase class I)
VLTLPAERTLTCHGCAPGVDPILFDTAFQPIMDLQQGTVFAYEALVRGLAGEGAHTVLNQLNDDNRYAFDQASRRQAIEIAASLGIVESGASLSINFMPGAMYDPTRCMRASVTAARRAGLPANRIIFEVVEQEHVSEVERLREIFRVYRETGFRNAIDDFGAGFAGLNLLADLTPDILKLDMALTRNIDSSAARRAIVAGFAGICHQLGLALIAEGIETEAELATLRSLGIRYAQGYLFARPKIRTLERPSL